MVKEPQFCLTTKDHAILKVILERYAGPRCPYLNLLDRKVRESDIRLQDDISPGVVTLNSRLTYLVDGSRHGPHLIVQAEAGGLPGFALSIHSLRGLALLGLAEGDPLVVDAGEAGTETLVVDHVQSQPEAEARLRRLSLRLARGAGEESPQNVVRLSAHPRWLAATDPDDGDPGPAAA
jgi:regulator of nucleoside diphosphate kinase